MNKYIISMIAVLVSSIARAGDLPSKSVPMPPVRPISYSQDDFFIGAHVGFKATERASWENVRANIRGGWEFSDYARLEADYDHTYSHDHKQVRSDMFTTNLIGQYRINSLPFIPYGLIGTGYRWSDPKNEVVYNIGGGVLYKITNNIEADARYRYITNGDRSRDENVMTFGVNYRF